MIKGHGDDAYRYEDITIVSDFSSNICPTRHHDKLMAHLAARPELLSHYPEPEPWTLERMLAEQHDIDPRCVIVTSGATDAIYLVAQAFRLKPFIPTPTFSEYADACHLFPTSQSGTIAWLCNPCNPTGYVYDQHQIELLSAKHTLTVIDQSYECYTRHFVSPPRWAVRLPNIIQLHSLTKTYGVPGLRLGYITTTPLLAKRLRRHLRPWAVSALAIEGGKFLVEHADEMRCHPNLDEARRLRLALSSIGGISVHPTMTNFMLCHIERATLTAQQLKEHLALQHGMLIRDASNFHSLSPQHFRVAAQTPQENDALVGAIQQYLNPGT